MKAWLGGLAAFGAALVLGGACAPTVDDGYGEIRDREGEACSIIGLERDCADDSVQFCDVRDVDRGEPEWGECLHEEELQCDPNGYTDCILERGIPIWAPAEDPWDGGGGGGGGEGDDTPLVLAFTPDSLELLPADASTFDISGRGGCMTTDWPSAATPWLAIDLDRNGNIDGGHELFGSGTVLASGEHAVNGFVALAELDANGDGVVDEADPRFGDLLLWSDLDGDRASTFWELEPLKERGIRSLGVEYQDRPDCDARGNCARERASFAYEAAGASRAGELVDLHFACQ